MTLFAATFVAASVLFTSDALAWGAKGHEITARAAVNALAKDFPAFFLAAKERLVFLCPEPDRWRGGREAPALGALNSPDHYFDLEYWGDAKIPNTRYDLLTQGFERGILSKTKPVSNLGTAPVVVAEYAEKLTNNFRQWRDANEDNRFQIEQDVIYNAGILAHFVTDLGNPMHCTVHHNGWAGEYPNPQNYPLVKDARGFHARFESQFVDQKVNEKDLPALLPPAHRTGPWVEEMERFIRRNNAMIDQLYQMDRANAYGSGKETPEELQFTLQRLADSAGMLRDVWTTAWLISHDEWIADTVQVYGRGGKTLLELLRERNRVETQKSAQGETVVSIGNRKNGLEDHAWGYYVAGKRGTESADKYVPRDNERVDWRFEGAVKAQ